MCVYVGGRGVCAQGAGFVYVPIHDSLMCGPVSAVPPHGNTSQKVRPERALCRGKGVFSRVWTWRRTFPFLGPGPSCMTTERACE